MPNVSKLNRKPGRSPVGLEAGRNRPGFVGLQRVLGRLRAGGREPKDLVAPARRPGLALQRGPLRRAFRGVEPPPHPAATRPRRTLDGRSWPPKGVGPAIPGTRIPWVGSPPERARAVRVPTPVPGLGVGDWADCPAGNGTGFTFNPCLPASVPVVGCSWLIGGRGGWPARGARPAAPPSLSISNNCTAPGPGGAIGVRSDCFAGWASPLGKGASRRRSKRPNDQAQRPPPETPGRLQQSLTNYLNRPTAQRGGGSLQRSG